MQLDALDKKILAELCLDSRTPILTLAKRVRTAREVVLYRIKRLEREKIICGYITEINFDKLGLIGAAVFVKINVEDEERFFQYLETCPFVSWVARLSGVWNFGLSIYGKNLENLDDNFLKLKKEFFLLKFRFSIHKKNKFFQEKLFFKDKKQLILPPLIHSLDKLDKIILEKLSKNSRITVVELSNKVGLTAPAVAKRIRILEKSDYIQKYSLFLDYSSLGLFQYSIFVESSSYSSLLSYLYSNPKISFIAEYVGDPFLEMGLILSDPYNLRIFLEEIEQKFKSQVIEVSLFQKDVVSVSPPKIAFE
ncbi:MAG: AsnC family transcriptional regulator [Nanoarchaeota archaeon]